MANDPINILVTGGAGFIGANFVHYLLLEAEDELGIRVNRVVTLDKLTYAGHLISLQDVRADERHFFVEGDINDSTLISNLLRDYKIDWLVHLAAESHVDRSIDSPEEFIRTNVLGTFSLLSAFKDYRDKQVLLNDAKEDALRFLHVSTDEVFGTLEEGDAAFSENSSYAPNSPYSASKAGGDHLVRSYHKTYNLPVITTNSSNNYGPFQFPEKLFPLMINKIMKGDSLPVYGKGENIRDWIYVRDHCRALLVTLLRGEIGGVYTIGSGCELRNIDVIHTLINVVKNLLPDLAVKNPEKLIKFVTDRPGHDKRYAINSDKISSELGWNPVENFDSGIVKTVQWYIDNEEWVKSVMKGVGSGERLGNL